LSISARGLTELDDIPSEGAVLGLDWEGVPPDAWNEPDGVPESEDPFGPAPKMGCCRGNSDPPPTELEGIWVP
jgi:hypothetical protein